MRKRSISSISSISSPSKRKFNFMVLQCTLTQNIEIRLC